MSDHQEIKNLVHNYCDRVCHNDQESWLDLWAEDGIWNIGRGPVRGRNEIRSAMASSMNLFESVIQLALNGTATTNEVEGEGRWYFSEFARTKSGKNLHYIAYYDDTYSRVDGNWKFASRSMTWLYQGPPDLSGVFGPPAGYHT